jgi:ribose transport system substrate-binding protein
MKLHCSSLAAWLTSVLSVTAVLAYGSGCTSSQRGDGDSREVKRIIFLTNGDDPFWDGAREGLNRAEEELNLQAEGFDAVQDRGDFTAPTQIERLNQYLAASDIAAVAISITEPENRQIMSALAKLRDKGVKVITVDSDVNRDKYRDTRFAYLGTDNIVAGMQLGKAAAVLRPEGGEFATFVGNKQQGNAIERIDGFAEGADKKKFKALVSMADGGDEQVAQDRVRVALDQFPELDVLVGIWAYNANAIVKLVKERNIRDKTTVAVFDAREIALDHMEEGNIDAMVVQNPYQMGYLSVKLLKAMIDEDHEAIQGVLPEYDPESKGFSTAEGDIFHTDLRLIVPDESSPIWEHREDGTFDSKLQFYTLEGFRQWLAERNLTGS